MPNVKSWSLAVGLVAHAAAVWAGCGGSSNSDGGPTCSTGEKRCEGACTNPHTDPQNCGACGNACGPAEVCAGGACVCRGGGGTTGGGGDATYCTPDGGTSYCADTATDNANCGSCSNACSAGSYCARATCTPCQKVLLLSTLFAAAPGLAAGIQQAEPSLCVVDYYDVNQATPTLAQLEGYQALLVYNDNIFPGYHDRAGVGDAVAGYFEGGGRVVIALFADGGYGIGGKWTINNYDLIMPGAFAKAAADSFSAAVPAQDVVPTSPVLAGVHAITSSANGSIVPNPTIVNGGMVVANWSSGQALAVTGVIADVNKVSHKRVDLNISPTDIATGAVTGDGFHLLANALLYQ
jgi:hypothetical protein